MKTFRFTSVVEQSGQPEVYLPFSDPKKDPHFQHALKAGQVMTVHQGGGKTDFGSVGYEPGPHREILLFPRSLKKFTGARIVGIDYQLLKQELAPAAKSEKPKSPAKKKEPKAKTAAKSKSAHKPAPEPPLEKVIPFHAEKPAEEEENEEAAELKSAIRRALALLEAGKQVAAFNILKRTVE